jgi:hypothetical protein
MKDAIEIVVDREALVAFLLRSPGLKLSRYEADSIVDIVEIQLRRSNEDCKVVEE